MVREYKIPLLLSPSLSPPLTATSAFAAPTNLTPRQLYVHSPSHSFSRTLANVNGQALLAAGPDALLLDFLAFLWDTPIADVLRRPGTYHWTSRRTSGYFTGSWVRRRRPMVVSLSRS